MDEAIKFRNGILFHDMVALADIRNCILNIDSFVLQELYILIKKDLDGELRKKFPTLTSFIESFQGDTRKLSAKVQEKVNSNPLLDFYNWNDFGSENWEPFLYCDMLYRELYYEKADLFGVIPTPTLLGNLFSISIGLDEFKKLYLLDEKCSLHIEHQLELLFKGNSKVELLEGTLEEVMQEINDINFFVFNNADDVQYLMKPRATRAEVLIPAFRSNLLNGDNLEEEPPILALPEGMDDYGNAFNLSINSIAIPI